MGVCVCVALEMSDEHLCGATEIFYVGICVYEGVHVKDGPIMVSFLTLNSPLFAPPPPWPPPLAPLLAPPSLAPHYQQPI